MWVRAQVGPQEGSTGEGVLAVDREGWSASPHDGVGVVCRGPEAFHTQGPFSIAPFPWALPRVHGDRAELPAGSGWSGIVWEGLSPMSQAARTNESKSHLFSQGQSMVIL